MDAHRQERRRVQRAPLATFCPVRFEYNDEQYSAFMLNISPVGAGFRIEETGTHVNVAPGAEVTFHIRTPYGESECTGRVVWKDHIGDHLSWGVQFTKLSDNEKDPLRCLIDSSF